MRNFLPGADRQFAPVGGGRHRYAPPRFPAHSSQATGTRSVSFCQLLWSFLEFLPVTVLWREVLSKVKNILWRHSGELCFTTECSTQREQTRVYDTDHNSGDDDLYFRGSDRRPAQQPSGLAGLILAVAPR